jgi:hypothetical protein
MPAPAPPAPRLLADAMLGALARWLRGLDVDTAYDPALDDPALVAKAVAPTSAAWRNGCTGPASIARRPPERGAADALSSQFGQSRPPGRSPGTTRKPRLRRARLSFCWIHQRWARRRLWRRPRPMPPSRT